LKISQNITDAPKVICQNDMVKMVFNTNKPFKGRIFVKGMVDKEQCVMNFVTNEKPNATFELKNGLCNMQRERKVSNNKLGAF